MFLVGCGGNENSSESVEPFVEKEGPLEVYTTIFPLFDFTKRIGGEFVNVTSLIPVGADTHTYEPTSKTMVEVSNSDLYIYNGVGIEGFANKIEKVLRKENVKILEASHGIELIAFDDDHDHHGHFFSTVKNKVLGFFGFDVEDDHHHHGEEDPHVWLDPIRAIEVARNIKEALIELKPSQKDEFEANFLLLEADLIALDELYQNTLSNLKRDTFVVSHAGYGYWTDRYGVKQVGISGVSPTNEPSIKQIQDIIDFITETNINYIIFEQNIPTNIAESVREQVGAEILWLHNLEALVQDDVTNNEDYFSLMVRNLETLKIALQ